MNRYFTVLLLILLLVACTQCTSQELSPGESQTQEETPWPENFSFCRHNPDDPSKPADCTSIGSAQEWLEFGPVVGDELWVWPEGMPLPPLPEGLSWSRERDPTNGENFWLIVEA